MTILAGLEEGVWPAAAAVDPFLSRPMREALGLTTLYNESLGTTSEAYQYDRIVDRDKPVADRKKRPWETVGVKAAAAKKSRA